MTDDYITTKIYEREFLDADGIDRDSLPSNTFRGRLWDNKTGKLKWLCAVGGLSAIISVCTLSAIKTLELPIRAKDFSPRATYSVLTEYADDVLDYHFGEQKAPARQTYSEPKEPESRLGKYFQTIDRNGKIVDLYQVASEEGSWQKPWNFVDRDCNGNIDDIILTESQDMGDSIREEGDFKVLRSERDSAAKKKLLEKADETIDYDLGQYATMFANAIRNKDGDGNSTYRIEKVEKQYGGFGIFGNHEFAFVYDTESNRLVQFRILRIIDDVDGEIMIGATSSHSSRIEKHFGDLAREAIHNAGYKLRECD